MGALARGERGSAPSSFATLVAKLSPPSLSLSRPCRSCPHRILPLLSRVRLAAVRNSCIAHAPSSTRTFLHPPDLLFVPHSSRILLHLHQAAGLPHLTHQPRHLSHNPTSTRAYPYGLLGLAPQPPAASTYITPFSPYLPPPAPLSRRFRGFVWIKGEYSRVAANNGSYPAIFTVYPQPS